MTVLTATLGLRSQYRISDKQAAKQTLWLVDHVPTALLDSSVREMWQEQGMATILVPFEELVILLSRADANTVKRITSQNYHLQANQQIIFGR